MLMHVRELSQMYRTLGPHRTCQTLTECLAMGRRGEPGGLQAQDFSIRDLAEALVPDGREWVRSLDPRNAVSVLEAGEAVDSTAFSNITGQLIISEVLAGYRSEDFQISGLFRTTPTRLNGEKIPGLAGVGDQTQTINEGMPYPSVGFGEDYIETPATTKYGLIVPVTKEAIFFDRTGLILERANEVGKSLGLAKEKRCCDVLIGATNNYKWKGTSYNTYQSSTPWINTLSGAAYALVDWSTVDVAEQLFADMLDPHTSEPIVITGGMTLVVPPALKHTANRILNATELRYATNSAVSTVVSSNPLAGSGYRAVVSRFFYRRCITGLSKSAANSKTCWYLGDIAASFRYMENWPITVVQAPQNSEAEFTQDIVLRFKASERGAAAVYDPRFSVFVAGHA